MSAAETRSQKDPNLRLKTENKVLGVGGKAVTAVVPKSQAGHNTKEKHIKNSTRRSHVPVVSEYSKRKGQGRTTNERKGQGETRA